MVVAVVTANRYDENVLKLENGGGCTALNIRTPVDTLKGEFHGV